MEQWQFLGIYLLQKGCIPGHYYYDDKLVQICGEIFWSLWFWWQSLQWYKLGSMPG
jgi:hypothetical protein